MHREIPTSPATKKNLELIKKITGMHNCFPTTPTPSPHFFLPGKSKEFEHIGFRKNILNNVHII